MPSAHEAIQGFFERFGMPAYAEGRVPDGARMPYVEWSCPIGAWGDACALSASVWMRSDSEAEANAKALDVARAIGPGGVVLPCDGGAVWLRRGSPFAQALADDDPAVRRRVLSAEAEFVTVF